MHKIFTVNLPDIGEGVVEGEVIEWLKNVGDELLQDMPVVIVMTDKATVELPAPYPGKLSKQYYKVGQVAIKDKPLYDIELLPTAQMPLESALPTSTEKPVELPSEKEAALKPHIVAKQPTSQKGLATPPVRALAKQMGIDLSTIQGSGKDGRILKEDLLPAAATSKSSQAEFMHLEGDQVEPLIGIRNLMAKKMAASKAHIPHFSYFEQVEVDGLIQLRHDMQHLAKAQGVHLTYMPFIIKALSLCIKKFPLLNSSYNEDINELIIHRPHHIGVAMATPLGLIVPVLKDVASMHLEQLILAYDDLLQRAKANKLLPAEMKGGTLTISNVGLPSAAGTWATPVINYPEVAILAISRIHAAPIVKDEQVLVRQVLNLSWSFDHRVIDGALAVHISHEFCNFIKNPATLL